MSNFIKDLKEKLVRLKAEVKNMDIFEAIHERRSVRKYKEKNVEEEKIEKVLNAARWAPSWANTQCWRFVVVKDKKIRNELASALSKNNPATDSVKTAPVVIVGCAEKEVSGYKKGEPVTEKGDWFMFDCGLAMQNLMLGAKALGLGTVQVGYFNSEKVKEILSLPNGIIPVAMTPLGYPEKEPKAPPRKNLDEIVFENKYGK